MTLLNYQFKFNSLTIGQSTPYIVTNVDGLGGISPLRIQDDNRGYIDGSYSGRDFYDERQVDIDVTIVGDNTYSAQYYYNEFQKAFAPQPVGYYPDPTGTTPASQQLKLFQFRLTGTTGDMRMYGRVRALETPITPEFTYGYIQTRVRLTFPDPRYYDDTGTITSGTSMTVANLGWAISCPVITVANITSTSGSITDGTTTMSFANLTLTSALRVDLLQRVIYEDLVPTRNLMTAASGGWLDIPPNTTSLTWTSTIGTMSTNYRNAYV